MAFKSAGIPETTLPVKNTFINFDKSPLLSPTELLRSASCPPFFPYATSLADAACWEGATQVLCHAMAPERHTQDTKVSTRLGDTEIPKPTQQISEVLDELVQSAFVTPVSTPRWFCSAASTPRWFCSATSQASGTPRSLATGGLEERTLSVESEGWTQVSTLRKKTRGAATHDQEPCRCNESVNALGARPNRAVYSKRHDIGIEDDDAFLVVRRLLGPYGENLKHISEASQGAKVWICGQDSHRTRGADVREVGPLKICIRATSQSSLREASALVQDLLQSTREDYNRFWSRRARAPSCAVACDAMAYSCSFLAGIEEDSTFQVVKRLVGKSGKTMKRIEAESNGASVVLCGRRSLKQDKSEGPLELHVSATTQASFDAAAASVKALLARVHGDYREFCALNGLPVPILTVA